MTDQPDITKDFSGTSQKPDNPAEDINVDFAVSEDDLPQYEKDRMRARQLEQDRLEEEAEQVARKKAQAAGDNPEGAAPLSLKEQSEKAGYTAAGNADEAAAGYSTGDPGADGGLYGRMVINQKMLRSMYAPNPRTRAAARQAVMRKIDGGIKKVMKMLAEKPDADCVYYKLGLINKTTDLSRQITGLLRDRMREVGNSPAGFDKFLKQAGLSGLSGQEQARIMEQLRQLPVLASVNDARDYKAQRAAQQQQETASKPAPPTS